MYTLYYLFQLFDFSHLYIIHYYINNMVILFIIQTYIMNNYQQ